MSQTSPRRTILTVLAFSLLAVASASQALSVRRPGLESGLQSPSFFTRSEPDQCFGEGRVPTPKACPTWDCDTPRCWREDEFPRKGGRRGFYDRDFEAPRGKQFRAACCVQP